MWNNTKIPKLNSYYSRIIKYETENIYFQIIDICKYCSITNMRQVSLVITN